MTIAEKYGKIIGSGAIYSYAADSLPMRPNDPKDAGREAIEPGLMRSVLIVAIVVEASRQ